jgi:hypothetical protein
MMVSAKSTGKGGATPKPPASAKPTTPAVKTETPTVTPKPNFKSAAAADKSVPATPEQPKATASVPASDAPKAEPSATKQQKEDEKLGLKLRRKGDILNALRSGGILILTPEGLYRIKNPDNSQNRVSKRRAASFVAQGLVKLTTTDANGKHYAFDPEAESAQAKKDDSMAAPTGQTGDTTKAPMPNGGN